LGDCWDHAAVEAVSKFAIAVIPDKRGLKSVRKLVGELAERSDHGLPELITSDEYKPYKRALLETYGEAISRRRRHRRGRQPGPRRRVPNGLVYATVHKHRRNGRVVRTSVHRIYGSAEQLEQALADSPVSSHVNVAFVERYNGTDRHLNSRKGRKVYRFSKDPGLHEAMTHYAQTVYNFCRPNRAVRLRQADGHWQSRCPAMVQGLTDHVWSIRELAYRQACPP
jgi:IS1 family transposase